MKVVKDTTLELGYRVWQLRPPFVSLTIVAKGTFDIPPNGGPCTWAAEQEPCHGEIFEDDDPLKALVRDSDLALVKPRGECFLSGTCWPPGERPARLSAIAFRVGTVAKSLAVIGDRQWQSTWRGGGASEPVPFESMPLAWSRSFGGAGFAANPSGRGVGDTATDAGPLPMLPNVENPTKLVTSKGDRPPPAGTFPIAPTWRSRQRAAGTYDARWRKTRWPWFPEDFDPAFFQAAPADQRIDGHWRGDEEIFLQNLHPEHARVTATLPGINAAIAIEVRRGGELSFEVVHARLDTIAIDADRMRVECLWRGIVEVPDEALDAVETLFLAHVDLDGLDDADALRARLDAKRAELVAAAAIEDEPPPPIVAPAGTTASATDPELDEAEAELQARLDEALAAAELEDATRAGRVALDETSVAPAGVLPAMGAAMAGAARATVAATAVEEGPDGEALDPDDVIAADALPEMEDVAEPDDDAPDDAPIPAEPPSMLTRADVEARIAAGGSLAGEDLTGLDLTGIRARGVDFSNAILREVILRSADLEGAKLDGAILANADLVGASLVRASLVRADLHRVIADGVFAEEAVLDGVLAERSSWARARLVRASAKGADLRGAMLAEAELRDAMLAEADLTAANVEQCDFAGASLARASLRHVAGALALFDGCDLTGVRATEGVAMPRASMKRVRANGSIWTGAVLNGANLSFAELEGADLSGAKLVEATLAGVVLRGARLFGTVMTGAEMVKADLFEALCEGADLSHADLRGANLFGAQLWRAKTDGARLDLADLTATHLDPA